MIVEPYKIESRQEADDYLTSLFEKPEYRSMNEARVRAQTYIKDPAIKDYFLKKAEEILRE